MKLLRLHIKGSHVYQLLSIGFYRSLVEKSMLDCWEVLHWNLDEFLGMILPSVESRPLSASA